MQETLQSAGFLLAIAGVAGLVHHFVNGFRLFAFVARIPFLARYDLYVSAALLVLGVALLIAGDRTKSQLSGPNESGPGPTR